MDRNKNDLKREYIDVGIKAFGDENEGKYELSFSSEDPYRRWFGTEILDHKDGAINLKRLNSIGCLLFNHNRDSVIGRIEKAWLEDGKGKAIVLFDSDEDAVKIKNKVDSKTLKGVSVAYSVEVWETVKEGSKSADGRFNGPCEIARKWTPHEISIVSVPADPTVGVGREKAANSENLSIYARLISVNKNYLEGTE